VLSQSYEERGSIQIDTSADTQLSAAADARKRAPLSTSLGNQKE